MVKRIKLMTDYQCYPLWRMDGEVGDIDPMTLSLSQETRDRLKKWVETYDAILNWDDPASSGFSNRQDADNFEREGIDLWNQLREELAPQYEVVYKSYTLQKVIYNPQELELIGTTV